MKKVVFIFFLSLLIFAGCENKKQEDISKNTKKDELVISVGSAITEGGFDPILGYGQYEPDIFHSTLLKFDENLNLQNDLATNYTISDDKKIYTFNIRDDIKFSDGKSLNAEDIVFTFMSAKNSDSLVDLTALENVKALNNSTIEFTLNRPFSPFLRSVATIGIVPKHAYDKNYGMHPIGSKAYKIAELKPSEQLILVPNEYYHDKKPYFKKITIVNIDEDAILAVAKSGIYDVLMINPEFAKENIDGMKMISLKTVDVRGFNLPVVAEFIDKNGIKRGNNVTSDIAIRKALNIGINRQNIINNALNGIGDVAFSRTKNLPWTEDEPYTSDNRVLEAKKILEDAGWILGNDGIYEKNGIKANFTITARSEDMQRYALALALSNEAIKLGIKIDAKSLAWSEILKNTYTTPTCWGFGAYNPIDIYLAYSSNSTGYYSASSYKNSDVDKYLTKALESVHEDEAMKNWKNAQFDGKIGINTDIPFIWLVNIKHTYFIKNGLNIGNQIPHPHGHGMPIIANLQEWSY